MRTYASPQEGGEYKVEKDVRGRPDLSESAEETVYAVYFRRDGAETWKFVKAFDLECEAVSFVKDEAEGDLEEKCLTVGELRRTLERLPDDCLVNTVDDSSVVGECVHVRHEKGSDYVDVGVVNNDRERGE